MKCLDTSILMRFAAGAPLSEHLGTFIINDLTLIEFCSVLLRKHNEKTAAYWFRKLQPYSYPLTQEMLYEAIVFRWKQKHGKMSFFDSVAYTFAQKQGFPLLTADSDFLNLPGVEFVRDR